jgi:3-oxoacyl-[acyl-carrier protein] reductase
LEAARTALEALHPGSVLALPADVSKPDDISALVEAVRRRFGRLDILVNNAGGPPPGRFEGFTDADWLNAFNLTLMSAVRTTRACLPLLKASDQARVLMISSYSVKSPIDSLMLSNSLRLAVTGWAKTLASEIGPFGVTVNSVCPGWTRTDRVTQMLNHRAAEAGGAAEAEAALAEKIPLRRLGEPEEVAALVVFLASAQAGYITGQAIAVDGGVNQSYG